jgi:hypothetical protein
MPTLGTLYCSPSDVYDALGAEGVDLTLDDRNDATGQQIVVSANAAANATSLAVAALTLPLLNGQVLQFEGSGTDQTSVTLSAVAQVGATSLTVAALANAINVNAKAVDTGVNTAAARRLLKACEYAKGEIDDYCTTRYDESQLLINAQLRGGSVGRWATTLAAFWICRRRRQGPSKGLMAEAEDVRDKLERVRASQYNIAYIGTRTTGYPFISNVEIDTRYEIGKVRVIAGLSEGTPTNYGQLVDWSSIYAITYW